MRHLAKLAFAGSVLVASSVHAADLTATISLECEEALALSALPQRLRDQASVYVLKDGAFELSRTNDGPFTCIVERNHPRALIPQCADAAGADSVVRGIMMKTLWSMDGASPEERDKRFDEAVRRGELEPPQRPGVSYMMSNFNYVWNWSADDTLRVPPHVMFYAPDLRNDDIGGSQQEGMGTNRGVPFIVDEGLHGYMISMVEHASDSAEVLAACAGQLPSDGTKSRREQQDRIDMAVRSPLRTDADRDRDASRKPRAFLEFLGVEEGDRVVEINAGNGYNARLLPSMVGESGHVYATNADFVLELFEGINHRLSESVKDVDNLSVSVQPDDRLELPTPVDIAILNNIYHDLHWQQIDTARFNSAVFGSLKQGGIFVVGDHSAVPGTGTSHVGTVHRIDKAVVISEIEAAGFELVATADFLANPDDDRLSHVIDPAIRGRTDRFMLKFLRPGATD